MDDIPKTKRSLGQHWLHDEASLLAMCEAALLKGTDNVLEIGPGLGTLTKLLTGGAKQVTAVEFDEKLAHELPRRIAATNLQVIQQDILQFDFSGLPPGYKVVANIPYYLTSNLIRVLSETPNPPDMAVLLLQKEVAERLAAQPGSMSLLSVSAQFYWLVSLGNVVPSRLFRPSPKVDSQIVILKRQPTLLFAEVDVKQFFRLVRAGFAQRRKTLLNNLSAALSLERQTVHSLCGQAAIDPKRRAQTLSLQEWYNIYKVWKEVL